MSLHTSCASVSSEFAIAKFTYTNLSEKLRNKRYTENA